MTTINLKPTWAAILPALLAVTRDGTPEGQRMAAEEFRRMAEAADRWNANADRLIRTLEFTLNDANTDLCAETATIIQEAITNAKETTA